MDRLTVLSAFTGLGGLDLGLESAGFENVGCIEIDELARQSLKSNRGGQWRLLDEGDVERVASTIRPSDVGLRPGELSLLAGGPPCQPYSKAAQWVRSARAGLADPRAQYLMDFLRLAEIFLPSVILIENVPGFVRGDVSALDAMVAELEAINDRQGTKYSISQQVVDAADYGVPQRRTRAIVVAQRDGRDFRFPDLTHARSHATAWDAIGGVEPRSPIPRASGKWADLLPSIPEGENYLHHTSRGGGEPLFGYRTRYWSFLLKLSRDSPSWTLPASPGPSTGPFHWDNRPLTHCEMLAIQTFPRDWIVEGSARAKVKQVGNATPPLLAEVMGRAIATQFFGREYDDEPLKHVVPTRRKARGSLDVADVPASFMALAGDHLEHPGAGKGPKPRTVT